MFFFRDPSWLFGLLPVAAVAAWSLLRPARQLATVASLELWREALDGLDRSRRSSRRRLTPAWALLLAGAAAAVLAAAGPTAEFSAPARRLAVAIYPSAEVASEEGMRLLRRSAGALLARLDARDRVQLILPYDATGGDWISPPEAARRLDDVKPVPLPAVELALPAAGTAAQRVYRVAPAGSRIPLVAGETMIEVPAALPPVSIDALSARPRSAQGAAARDANVEVFLAMLNTSGGPRRPRWRLTAWDDGGAADTRTGLLPALEAGERGMAFADVPAFRYLLAEVDGGEGSAASRAFLARRDEARAKVAIVGEDDPLVRRFIRVNPELAPAAGPEEADVLVCIGQDPVPAAPGPRAPGANKPALVIHPPSPPAGAAAGGAMANVVLREEEAAEAGDPLMHDVDLRAVAIRRVTPWRLGDKGIAPGSPAGGLKPLCAIRGEAIIARTAPELGGEPGEPRRVYIAFALDTQNTNFAATESFVVFLANAFRWLSPRQVGEARYEFLPPSRAARRDDWKPISAGGAEGPAGAAGPDWAKGPCLPPGVYLDANGDCHAVSMVGLRPAPAAEDHLHAAADAPLPDPQPAETSLYLGPWLAMAAVALWLAGWGVRTRSA
jgi:hypothetical protein